MNSKTDKAFEKLDIRVNKLIASGEKDITKNYLDSLEDLRTTIRKLFDKYEKKGKLSAEEMAKYDRLKVLDEKLALRANKLHSDNDTVIKGTLKSVFNETVRSMFNIADEKSKKYISPVKKKLDAEKTVNADMAGLNWAKRTAHHRDSLIYELQSTLRAGIYNGATYKEMSDILKKTLNTDYGKIMTIVRTESGRVYSQAEFDSAQKLQENGIISVKVWKTSKDERVRAAHRALDGKTLKTDEDFMFSDGITTKAPRLSGTAKHDINCRCYLSYDFYDEEDIKKSNLNNRPNFFDHMSHEEKEEYDKTYKKFTRRKQDKEQYIRYTEVLGKKDMPGTFDKFQDIKYNDKEEYERYKLEYKDERLKQNIRSSFNLTINEGRQGKHIKGHNSYSGKSYLLETTDPQKLVDEYAGTGQIQRSKKTGKWTNKQFFEHNDYIGYVYADGKWIKTKYFSIHYSKEKGTHIVPRFKEDKNDKH